MVRPARRLVCGLLLIAVIGAAAFSTPPSPKTSPAPHMTMQSFDARQPGNPALRAILDFFALGYAASTDPATQIKWLFLRGQAMLIAVASLIAWGLSVRRPTLPAPEAEHAKKLPSVHAWTLLLAVAWLGWSALAATWSHAPQISILFAENFAFVVALAAVTAVVLDRPLAEWSAAAWLSAAAIIGAIAILFRLDTGRPAAVFTGDSRELAGILLPAFVLAIVMVVGRGARPSSLRDAAPAGRRSSPLAALLLPLIATALLGGAIFACGPAAWRGTFVAAAAGLGVAAVVVARRRWRIVWLAATMAIVPLLAWLLVFNQPPDPPFTPDSPQRAAQLDRWSLSWELVGGRPIAGHGPWSARLLANGAAERRAIFDPRYADLTVDSIDNFWLEQLADVGVVGAILLAASLTLVVVSAARPAGGGPEQRRRYLPAALAGGLVAMAAHELFASSLARPAFATVFACWIGLAIAAGRCRKPPVEASKTKPLAQPHKKAKRHAAPVPMGGPADPYAVGFYPGGIAFLAGAAVILASVGYFVVKDFTSARGQFLATAEDLPQAEGIADPLLTLPPRQAERRRLIEQADRQLSDAERWTVDYPRRLDASWQRARAASLDASLQVREQLQIGAAGLRRPAPLTATASWSDSVRASIRRLNALEAIRPCGQVRLTDSLAEQWLLYARCRWLSLEFPPGSELAREQNPLLLDETVAAVSTARKILDSRLADYPYDLPAALLRLAVADRNGLARLMALAPASADWLAARASLGLSPGRRLRMLRDAMRDFSLIACEPGNWRITIGPGEWDGLWQEMNSATIQAELARPAAAAEFEAMLRTAEAIGQPAGGTRRGWITSTNPDERNAPQTLRLAAEMILARNFIRARSGLPALPGEPEALAAADVRFTQAARLYDMDPGRFALQRVMVLLARAQLAWGARSDEALGFADRAEQALADIPAHQRPSAEQAVATVKAFLLADSGRGDQTRPMVRQVAGQSVGHHGSVPK